MIKSISNHFPLKKPLPLIRRISTNVQTEQLSRRVLGQPHAIKAARDAFRISKFELNCPKKPIATLLAIGPAATGTTHLARVVSEIYFEDKNKLTQFNKYDEGFPLRSNEGVILINNVEKVHSKVNKAIIELFNQNDLRKFFVILRSKALSSEITEQYKSLQSTMSDRVKIASNCLSHIQDKLPDYFSEAVLNKVDDVIPFLPLSRDNLKQIVVDKSHEFAVDVFRRHEIVIRYDQSLIEELEFEASKPKIRANQLDGIVRDFIIAPLSKKFKEDNPSSGIVYNISYSSGQALIT